MERPWDVFLYLEYHYLQSLLGSKMENKGQTTINGIKQEMTQIFREDGVVIPVTKVLCTEDLNLEYQDKKVEVVGHAKGKGFTGVMKKWNFKGSMATRGQSDKPRAPGSIGAQTPGRVFKGKKMAGRSGNQQVTLKNIKIVKIVPEKRELFISGPVPGSRNSKVLIRVL